MGKVDESFRKPGAVPFKWESKPGVPKPYHAPARDLPRSSPKLTPPPSGLYYTPPPDLGTNSTRSFRSKLTPPPSGLYYTPPPDLGTNSTRSFRSAPRLKPDQHRLEPIVVSSGCFFSPLFRRRWGRKNKKVAHKASPEHEPWDLGTLARWTDSGRKSLSLWESSTYSSSFSSYRSSPQPIGDPEWPGFVLF